MESIYLIIAGKNKSIHNVIKNGLFIDNDLNCVALFSDFNFIKKDKLIDHNRNIRINKECALLIKIKKDHFNVSDYVIKNYLTRYKIFLQCIENNDISAVSYLLTNGLDVHYNEDEALIKSAKLGYFEMIILLIDNGACVNPRGNHYILSNSAKLGRLDIVRYLVEHGAYVHSSDDCALHESANNGHFDIVRYLVENGADIHSFNEYALRHSSANGHLEIVKYLIEHGAVVHDSIQGSIRNGHLKIVELLVNNGAIITPLLLCIGAKEGHLHIVKFLVNQGVLINDIEHNALCASIRGSS